MCLSAKPQKLNEVLWFQYDDNPTYAIFKMGGWLQTNKCFRMDNQ